MGGLLFGVGVQWALRFAIGPARWRGRATELAEIVASWSKRRAALIDEGLGDEAFDVVREELRSRGCGDPDRFIAGVQGRTKRTVNG
jgi:hypothetical protein